MAENRGYKAQGVDLVWLTVKNFDESVKFYRDIIGLELKDYVEEYQWAELEGQDGGARIGICPTSDECPLKPGQNAVVSISVDNLEAATKFFESKGGKLVGPMQEIPGHVKMQMITDPSGNYLHLVERDPSFFPS